MTLQQLPVFRTCSNDVLEHILAPFIKVCVFKENEVILREGEEPPGVFVIISGLVKLISRADERQLVIEISGKGDLLGYEPILSRLVCGEDAIAMETTKTYMIPKDDFKFCLGQNSNFAQKMLKLASNRLEQTRKQMVDLCYQPARQRVAAALIYLSQVYLKHEAANFRASRTDVAHLSAVRRETATKVVKDFEHEGLVNIEGEAVMIISREGLLKVRDMYNHRAFSLAHQ